jgi:hypothetical protein
MTQAEFDAMINRDIQRMVNKAAAEYEAAQAANLNDDDTYIIDEATRTIVRNAGNVRWSPWSAFPYKLEAGQVAMRGLRAKYYVVA